MDFCSSNPCQNGGTCNLMEGSKKKNSKEVGTFTYDCECPLGFEGEQCESECAVFHSTFIKNTALSIQIKCSSHKKLEHLCICVASVLPTVGHTSIYIKLLSMINSKYLFNCTQFSCNLGWLGLPKRG